MKEIKCMHGNRPHECAKCAEDCSAEGSAAAPCSPHDLPETECGECGWMGDAPDLIDGKCPDCGSSSIIDFEPEENEKGQ